jgi:pimeloyl-ACP methyl ester carboxylesterase
MSPPIVTVPSAPRKASLSRRVLAGVLTPLGVLLAVVVGLLVEAFFGGIIGRIVPTVAIASIFAVGSALLIGSGLGRLAGGNPRKRSIICALIVAAACVGALVAVKGASSRVPAASAGVADPRGTPRMLSLSTGSRVAVWERPALTGSPTKETPVIFVHGGPGMFTTMDKIEWGSVARDLGYSTVYFDQAGSGASDPLPVNGFTADRAVKDLEALRVSLNAEGIVLWGHSFGATIATAYAAKFPARVRGLLLTSPGPFPGSTVVRDYAKTARGDTSVPGDIAFTSLLIGQSAKLGESYLSQRNAGQLFDSFAQRVLLPAGYCIGTTGRTSTQPNVGGNLFANRLLASSFAAKSKSPNLDALKTVKGLVLRGSCDYLPPENSKRYADALGLTAPVSIEGAGHDISTNREAANAAITSFLSSLV